MFLMSEVKVLCQNIYLHHALIGKILRILKDLTREKADLKNQLFPTLVPVRSATRKLEAHHNHSCSCASQSQDMESVTYACFGGQKSVHFLSILGIIFDKHIDFSQEHSPCWRQSLPNDSLSVAARVQLRALFPEIWELMYRDYGVLGSKCVFSM